jgi:hypothetical protein
MEIKQKSLSSIHYAYEKVSTHPGYRFSRTLENLRKVSKSIRSNRIYSVGLRPKLGNTYYYVMKQAPPEKLAKLVSIVTTRQFPLQQEEEEMKLCLMILSVPWYMFNGLEHTAILSHFLTFITGSSSRVSTMHTTFQLTSLLQIYNIIKQSFISSSSCPK